MRRFKDLDKSLFLLLGLSLANFVIHLVTNGQYGFFRDELYILDCAKHLDLGYADMPPLTPFFAKIVISFLGETLQGLRFFPAFLSSMMVLMTGLMTREMGGKLYAQLLASIAFMIAPIFLVAGTQFQTIVVDQFFWVLTCYLLIKLINSDNQKLWLLMGVALGLGLLTKYSAAFLGFAIFFGLIMSHHRKILNQRWIWFGVSIALLLFLPNLVWQIQNGLPVVDHMEVLGRDETTPSLQFLIEQIIILHPLNLPIWITGIIFLTKSESGKKYLPLVWIYFIPLLVFLLMQGKSYYLAPAYPILFAGGSILIEQFISTRKLRWLKYAFPSLLVLTAVVLSPLWLPILPIQKMKDLGISEFRYDYREMIGWPDLVKSVAKVYHDLPIKEQEYTLIITGNYGEAGAINHYRSSFNLPEASSGISSYYYWGPSNPNATTYIFVGYSEEYLHEFFSEVSTREIISNPYGIINEEEGQRIILCRHQNQPLAVLWDVLKHY